MSLMTPRYVIDDDREEPSGETTVLDRWEEAGSGAGYVFSSGADAMEFASDKNAEFAPMNIVYRKSNQIQLRAICPQKLWYSLVGTMHHSGPQWFLKALALDRGEPGDIAGALRDFPLSEILAWDV